MKPIDYKYWLTFNHWTFEQAAYLLSNINPNDEEHIALLNNVNYKRIHSNHFGSIDTFNKNLQLIKGTDFSKYGVGNVQTGCVLLKSIFNFANEHNIWKFPSRLNREWENIHIPPNKQTVATTATAAIEDTKASNQNHFGNNTIDAFDPLPISGIAQLFLPIAPSFSTDRWKTLASKARVNGLIKARESIIGGRAESTFNPIRVANWLISKKGFSPERLERRLKKNLPERSKDLKEEIFGFD